MKILITGASGMLGTALIREYVNSGYSVVAVCGISGIAEKRDAVATYHCDLSQPETVVEIIETEVPDALVHAGALTNHGYCENNPEVTRMINAVSTGSIAECCKKLGIYMIYVSSESVYGESEDMHSEGEDCSPVSVYSLTKYEGEKLVEASDANAAILRTTIVGQSPKGDRSLVDWASRELSQGNEITGFDDVLFTPISVEDFAKVSVSFIKTKSRGVWNVGVSDSISKYQFLVALANHRGYPVDKIKKGSLSDACLVGKRCQNASLNTEKLRSEFPEFTISVEQTIRSIFNIN